MTLLNPGANVVIDGQWGSTGKGKLASYLADQVTLDYATVDFQPNAGHTTVYKGKEYVLHCLPGAFVNLDAKLCIAPAASIKVEQLIHEIDMLSDFGVQDRLFIHPHTGVVTQEDMDEEAESMRAIASTMQGTGAALSRKIRRKAKLAKDFPDLAPWIHDFVPDLNRTLREGGKAQIETAQGFDLSLNHGWEYPYTTSRDVTTAGALANVGVPPQHVARVWASMRTYPIRVGNIEGGNSGPFYGDQRELDWEEVSRLAGKEGLCETTTVTGRVRRVFTWSDRQFMRFLDTCAPTDIFLNFVNYLDWSIYGESHHAPFPSPDLPEKVDTFVMEVDDTALFHMGHNCPEVRLLGTGPDHTHMVVL